MDELDRRSDEQPLSLQALENNLRGALRTMGLPSEGVLVGIEERQVVAANFLVPLGRLGQAQISRSLYLSKFFAAVCSGLFDAALNYLWDETVTELRRRIAGYDLAYFFDLAVSDPDRRKRLQNEDDLKKVEDSELILAANTMGLISDTGRRQLDLVRYMRNYASAAHPNQTEITGLQLMGWLDTCIVEVINLPESGVVVQIRKLLGNLKANKLSADDARMVAASFGDLPNDQADNLGNGLFGVYTNLSSSNETRDNVRLLMPKLWPYLGEDVKRGLGVKFFRYQVNNDADQARLAREILDAVDANAYLPESVRAAELDRAIDDLLLAHHGLDNFYTEPPLARALRTAVGQKYRVPAQVEAKYVRALVELYLGNGYGVAWNAEPVYEDLIDKFDVREAEFALLTFADPTVSSRLQATIPQKQWVKLLDILEPKITGQNARELFAVLTAYNRPMWLMADDPSLLRFLNQAPQSVGSKRRDRGRVTEPGGIAR